MLVAELTSFDAPQLAAQLNCMSDAELDALPFGVIEMNHQFKVLRYNATESRYSGLASDLAIDTGARTVTRAGEAIILTAREYAILEYLAFHRGEVVTRTALYEHLFDESDDTLSNLLDVHVFNLRKKLGRDLIVTRRGQGYCMEA